MCKNLHSTSVARRDTITAQRRGTPATCREPCPPNRHPRPDTATAKSMARCGTISAQRHISAQPTGTEASRLARTLHEDVDKGFYPPHNLTPKKLLPCDRIHIQVHAGGVQQRNCTSETSLRRVAQCAKTGAGGALHRPTQCERLHNRRSARR